MATLMDNGPYLKQGKNGEMKCEEEEVKEGLLFVLLNCLSSTWAFLSV